VGDCERGEALRREELRGAERDGGRKHFIPGRKLALNGGTEDRDPVDCGTINRSGGGTAFDEKRTSPWQRSKPGNQVI